MPGGIATELQRYVGTEYMEWPAARFKHAGSALKTVEHGAATSVLLATSPLLERVGALLRGLQRGSLIHRRGEACLGGVAPYALDRDNAERLWEVSLGRGSG